MAQIFLKFILSIIVIISFIKAKKVFSRLFFKIISIIVILLIIWFNEVQNPINWIQRKVFEKLPLQKFSEIPQLGYSIKDINLNYSPGLEIDGIKWDEDFKEYLLVIRNKSKKTDIFDLRIDLDMPYIIIHYKIISQVGCEGIDITQGYLSSGIGSKRTITKTFKTYSNNLKINAIRLFPESRFEVKLIIKLLPQDYDSGFLGIKYSYLDVNRDTVNKSLTHDILIKDEIRRTLYIDADRQSQTKYRSVILAPEKPLIFRKNGSIEQKIEQNNR